MVGALDQDDVSDLLGSWKRFPPPPIALRRLEGVLMAAHHLKLADPAAPEAEAAPAEPPSPEDLRRALDSFNARFSGKVPRI